MTITRGGKEKEKAAEEFLRSVSGPDAPRHLRDFGLQRVIARASTEEGRAARRRERRNPALLRRVVLVSLASILLLAATTSGVYAASSGSLPGTTLYGAKIFFERARVALALSPASDARLEMEYCTRRTRELSDMVERGSTRGWERWLREYTRNLEGAESALEALPAEEASPLARRFAELLEEQALLVESLQEKAPGDGLPYLREAYEECRKGMEHMRKHCAESGGSAGGEPPGGEKGGSCPGERGGGNRHHSP